MYFLRGWDESGSYADLPWDGWKYEKLVAARSYELGLDYPYDEQGFIIEWMEQKMLDGAVVMITDTQFYSAYALEIRKRWGYDPFRFSKNTARLYAYNSVILMQHDTVLLEVFNMDVMRMRCGGLLEKYKEKVAVDPLLNEELEPIDMRHLLLGLGIYLFILFLSVLVFFNEYFFQGRLCNPKHFHKKYSFGCTKRV